MRGGFRIVLAALLPAALLGALAVSRRGRAKKA